MQKITLDRELRKRLLQLNEPMELCDESGTVVGRVFPVFDMANYEPCESPTDEKELRRREASQKWYTTEQVLAHLEKLAESEG